MALSNGKIQWFLLASAAIAIVFFFSQRRDEAYAQQMSSYNSDDVIAMPLEMGTEKSGFVLIDVKLARIMVYEIDQRRGSSNKLKLVAVRNFSYDRLLEQYNNAEPSPEMLQRQFFSSDSGQGSDSDEPSKENIRKLISDPQD